MSLKVYYLDDERELCENFRDLYSSDDVHIETFSSPEALIREAHEFKPDIVFLDYRLINITGDKVASQIDPSIPVVLLTGDIQIKTDFNFLSILEKPVNDRLILNIFETLNSKSVKG